MLKSCTFFLYALIVWVFLSCASGQEKQQYFYFEDSVWRFANDDGTVELSFKKDGVISFYAKTQSSSGLYLDLEEDLYLVSFGGENVDVIRIAYDMFSFLGMVFVQEPETKNAALDGTKWKSLQETLEHTLSFENESVIWTCTASFHGTYTDKGGGALYLSFDELGTINARVQDNRLSFGGFVFIKQ